MINRIRALLEQGEGICVEFKEAKMGCPKNIYETVCSFLNRNGGEILLGVSDEGEITGVEEWAINEIKNDFVTSINNPTVLSPTFYLSIDDIEIEGQEVLYIRVPEGSQVYRTKGKIFDRNEDGDFDVTNNNELVTQAYLRKQSTYSENEVFPYVEITDLREDLINKARIRAVNFQRNHIWGNLTNEELLKSAGLKLKNFRTGVEGYTLACILLFGKDEVIRSVLPSHRTDAIMRKVNIDRYDDREDIRCNLIESYERLIGFINKHTNETFHLDGVQRINVRDMLFREIVANMLIHREYNSVYPAKLIIEKDKVITENANKAIGYGEIDISNFQPKSKNPTIAKVFREIGLAEELGSGVRNVAKYSKIYSASEPKFIEGDIFKTEVNLIMSNKKSNKKFMESPNVAKILDYLETKEKITSTTAREITGLSIEGVRKILQKLHAQGVIEAHGANRNRTYTLRSSDND